MIYNETITLDEAMSSYNFTMDSTSENDYEYTNDEFYDNVIEVNEAYNQTLPTDMLITEIPKFVTTTAGAGKFVFTVKRSGDDFMYGCGWVNSHTHKNIWMNYKYDYTEALSEAYSYAIKEGWLDIEEY